MAEFYVERQYWTRWPRVLLMCRKHGNMETGNVTVERRRYVPDKGLDKALDRASAFAAEASGSCPLDMFGFEAKKCGEECDDSYAECWRKYFEREGA